MEHVDGGYLREQLIHDGLDRLVLQGLSPSRGRGDRLDDVGGLAPIGAAERLTVGGPAALREPFVRRGRGP